MTFWTKVKNFFEHSRGGSFAPLYSHNHMAAVALHKDVRAADMERVTQEYVDSIEADYTLVRVCENENGTFGVLMRGKVPICVTVEDRWRDNKRGISCIPEGLYTCKPHNGRKFKNVWILQDVPDRSAILIHAGNTEDSTTGCIIVGSMFGNLGGKHAVLRSKEALAKLRDTMPPNYTLRVTSA